MTVRRMTANAHLIPEPPNDAFWVFAYGSLMWNPGFEYSTSLGARLFGYRRTLCILSYVYRGSRNCPGLVFGLDAGGSCMGRVFRINKSRRLETYDYLMEREMIQGVYRPRWLQVNTSSGRVTALCFVADRGHEQYVPALSEHQIVDRIKGARGKGGSNVDYIVNTCGHLEELGIHSRKLARIRDALIGDARQ